MKLPFLLSAVTAALVAVAVLVSAPAASAAPAAGQGYYLSIGAGKREIKSSIKSTQIGYAFLSKVSDCWKPRNDRVQCFWQSAEIYEGEWLNCFGIAKATDRYGWVNVNLGRNWADDCYYTEQFDPFI